jgi:hypothetical protein
MSRRKVLSAVILFFICLCSWAPGQANPRDSLGMRLLGQTLLGPARQVVVQGNYAYVGVSCGLLILDVSDPAQPVEMGRAYDVNFTIIEDVFVQNGYAYLVDALNGLAIVDVRDVRNPRVVGRARNNGHMTGVWVKDTLAYMVGSNSLPDSSDFLVINVKDPTTPFAVAGYDTCSGEKVQVVDTLAFVADGLALDVYAVSNPLSIRRVAQYFNVGSSRKDVCVLDTFCYVVSQDSGLVILNIRDPLNPQKLGTCKPTGGPMRISVQGSYAYLCEYLDAYQLAYAYPPRNLSHLWVVDISDPVNPVERGLFVSPGFGGDVFAKDSLVYFADGGRGLRVMDVRNATQPREISHYSTGDACWQMLRQGEYLYVAHGGDGLRVLDMTNPAQPMEFSHLEMPWRTFDIFIKDSLLYSAEGDSGLVVVDIRNPAQPQIIGRWPVPGGGVAFGVFVQDTLAYLSGNFWGNFWVVDVADPRNPYYLGGWGGASSNVSGLWVRGRYAYLTDGIPWTFHVLDVSDPHLINEVYPWAWLAPGVKLEMADTLGFILGGLNFEVITIADSVRPDTAGGYARPGFVDGGYGLHYFPPGFVWVGWHTYYYQIPEHCGRMDLLDVRNPHPVRSIAHYETGWTISDVWGEDLNYAYGGGYLGNMYVFKIDSAVGTEQGVGEQRAFSEPDVQIHPNPVKGSCVIRYWSGKESKVRLTFYDLTGRVMRVWTSSVSRFPSQEFVWDGRDSQGKEVRSGVYFLRVEGGVKDITKKVIVVR